jgi:small GTP-binding protein
MKAGKTPRVVLCGSMSSGKTSLAHYAVNNSKIDMVRPTTGAMFSRYSTSDFPIRSIDLWDTAGMEQYQSLNAGYYESANGAILVFDITSRSSFEKLEFFLKELLEKARAVPTIVVAANKYDLKADEEEVTEDEIEEWCKSHGFLWFYTSALTGYNVIRLFDTITRNIPEIEETVSAISIENQEVVNRCC